MASWPTLSLRDAGVALIDCVHKTPAAAPDGYPYVAIPQMKDGKIDFTDARRISEADFLEWTKKARPQLHDVVLSRRTNPGVTATFGDRCDFALGQNLVLLRADGRRVRPAFLRWLVRSPTWWQQIDKFLNVGAVFDSLRCADVPRFELPIPPLAEQTKIGAILDSLDDKIELNRRMNETLEAMARTIFQDWFVAFGPTRAKMEGRPPYLAPDLWALFPDRLDAEGKPEGWEMLALSHFAEATRGLSYKGDGLSDTGIPLHNLNSIYEGGGYKNDGIKFYAGTYAPRHRVNAGDILVANTEQGHDRRLIGFAAVVPRSYGSQSIFSQHLYRLQISPSGPVTAHWLCHLLNSKSTHQVVSGYANGSTVNMLPIEALREPCFATPPSPLVRSFDAIAIAAAELVEQNLSECRTLAAMRDLLLPRLMSGELRVRDAEPLVAQVA